jgi:hypothetical protein
LVAELPRTPFKVTDQVVVTPRPDSTNRTA